MGSDDFKKKIKLLLKDTSLTAEIVNRSRLKNVYSAGEIVAAAGHYGQPAEDLINKKGRWNRGKRILMYLLSRDAGKNNTEIGSLIGGIHHSSVGRTITRVISEIQANKKMAGDIAEIASKYERTVA